MLTFEITEEEFRDFQTGGGLRVLVGNKSLRATNVWVEHKYQYNTIPMININMDLQFGGLAIESDKQNAHKPERCAEADSRRVHRLGAYVKRMLRLLGRAARNASDRKRSPV